MFKLRNLITIVIMLVAGILLYNSYFGTPDEKAQAKTTFKTIGKAFKEVGNAIGGLLKTEKEKFDEGKYDKAMDKISDLFKKLGDKTKDLKVNKEEYMDKISELQRQKEALKEKISEAGKKEMTDDESVRINDELRNNVNSLFEDLKKTVKEAGVESE